MKKQSYRDCFAECSEFLKMKYFLKRAGIASSTFSMFMKGPEYDYMLSEKKLKTLYDLIRFQIHGF